MQNLNLKLSNTIRSIRESKRIKQIYMSQKLKVTQQAYSRMEQNPEKLSLIRLKQIAEILEVELTTLLGIDINSMHQNFQNQSATTTTALLHSITTDEKSDLYERIIAQLKEEIAYLRPLGLGKKMNQHGTIDE